ncbi:MAG: PilZ domain-containing protein [Candidatus Omnitrophica bacterium]|nr:PilZ domain-containing protein [Candidatus Omnitrophota bacterium]
MAGKKLERRQFPRTSHTYTISFKGRVDEEENWDISNTKNLSLGGAFFLNNEFFPLGSTLDIRLNIPGQNKYCACRGKVQRCEGPFENTYYKTAVQFSDIDNRLEEALKKSIDFFMAKDNKKI